MAPHDPIATSEHKWSEQGAWGESGMPRFALFQNRKTRAFKVFKVQRSWLVGLASPVWTIQHGFKEAAAITWLALSVAVVASVLGEPGAVAFYALTCLWVRDAGPSWLVRKGLSDWAESDVLDLGINTAKNAEMAVRAAQASADRHWSFMEQLVRQPPEVIDQALALLSERD
jgi:hypothetical protein